MDNATAKELCAFVLESIRLIRKRFENIHTSDDFLKDDWGLDMLDAISMRLQAIGEALKNLDKRERKHFLQIAPKEYWSQIIKTRDFISHHYVDIDSETVYEICSSELDELEANILRLQTSLQ